MMQSDRVSAARTRLRGLTLCLALATAVWVNGCSEDDTTEPPAEFAPPTNLIYINDDGSVFLQWSASPDAAISDFAGYTVYRSTSSMAALTPSQLAGLKLNATPQAALNMSPSAANGTKYYYAVAAAKDNGNISELSNQIDTAARAESDQIELSEFRFTSEPSGLNLETGTAYEMESSSPDNRPFIDVYLGTTDPDDSIDSPLAFKSPSLVLDGDPRWANRVGKVQVLANFDTPTADTGDWLDTVTLGTNAEAVGKVIAVRTPIDGEGHYFYAKLRVDAVSGAAGQRQITLTRAYQSLPDYIRFRPR